MSLRQTVTAKTMGSTLNNTNSFIPKINFMRVLEVTTGNTFWASTYFMGSLTRFYFKIKGLEDPPIANHQQRQSSKILYRELRSLIDGKVVEVRNISWGRAGSLEGTVISDSKNIRTHMVAAGLTSSIGKPGKISVIEQWILVNENDKKVKQSNLPISPGIIL